MPALLDHPRTLQPSPKNREGALLLVRILETAQTQPEAEPLRAELLTFLRSMGNGQGFAIMALDRELTPNQAAEFLGVSRSYFMRALQQGAIPHRKVGSHHRVRLHDVLKLQEEDRQRDEALTELTQQAQELDMGY